MPWTAGFQTTVIGPDEARLVAVRGLMIDSTKLSDLNATLALSPFSSFPTVTSANFLIGDPDTFAESKPVIVCVYGGGKGAGLDRESMFKEIGMPNVSTIKNTFHTNIRVYIHPNYAFPAADSTATSVEQQAEYRERLLSRVVEWICSDIFATVAGVDTTLTSQQMTQTGDNFTMTYVSQVQKGVFEKGIEGKFRCLGAQLTLTSTLQ